MSERDAGGQPRPGVGSGSDAARGGAQQQATAGGATSSRVRTVHGFARGRGSPAQSWTCALRRYSRDGGNIISHNPVFHSFAYRAFAPLRGGGRQPGSTVTPASLRWRCRRSTLPAESQAPRPDDARKVQVAAAPTQIRLLTGKGLKHCRQPRYCPRPPALRTHWTAPHLWPGSEAGPDLPLSFPATLTTDGLFAGRTTRTSLQLIRTAAG